MANLLDIIAYKNTLIDHLISNQEIVEILLPEVNSIENAKAILVDPQNGQIFNYEYVPNPGDTAKTYICVECNISKIDTKSIKNVSFHISVFTTPSLMKYEKNGFRGNRIDLLCEKIDEFMNGNNSFGIGKSTLIYSRRLKSIQGYYGRTMVYTTSDFNRMKSR